MSRVEGVGWTRGRSADAIVVASFALLTCYFTGVFPPHPNVNELSRLQAVVAFVERGTFQIDEEIKTLGDHEDKSVSGGHFYSNKAPGLAFAAVPVYRALRTVLPPPETGTSSIFVLMRLLTVSLISVIALWRFTVLLRRSGGGAETALIVAAVALGTPFLFYARSFFSHAWTASLLFLAFERIHATDRSGGRSLRAALVAGLLAGWAGISEFPVLILLPFFFWRALSGWRWARALAFSAAAAIPIGLLLVYNAVCFGSPWTISTQHEAHPQFQELYASGVSGIGVPEPRILLAYLFHSNRGVLPASPFLAWVAAGFLVWWRRRLARSDLTLCFMTTAAFLILMSGYPSWEGGWCLGSRYLIPVLLMAAVAIPHALESRLSRGLFVAGVTFAVAHYGLLASSFPYFPPSLPWPAATGSLWFLARGLAAPSLGTLAGLPPLLSLLIPGILVALAIVSAVRAFPVTKPGKPLAAVLGVAAFCATLRVPVRLAPWDQQWREGILRLFVSP